MMKKMKMNRNQKIHAKLWNKRREKTEEQGITCGLVPYLHSIIYALYVIFTVLFFYVTFMCVARHPELSLCIGSPQKYTTIGLLGSLKAIMIERENRISTIAMKTVKNDSYEIKVRHYMCYVLRKRILTKRTFLFQNHPT